MVAAEYATGLDPADNPLAEPVDPAARRDRLRLVADRAAPLALARERTLPLLSAVADLFPDGALRRGSVVGVDGVGRVAALLAGIVHLEACTVAFQSAVIPDLTAGFRIERGLLQDHHARQATIQPLHRLALVKQRRDA